MLYVAFLKKNSPNFFRLAAYRLQYQFKNVPVKGVDVKHKLVNKGKSKQIVYVRKTLPVKRFRLLIAFAPDGIPEHLGTNRKSLRNITEYIEQAKIIATEEPKKKSCFTQFISKATAISQNESAKGLLILDAHKKWGDFLKRLSEEIAQNKSKQSGHEQTVQISANRFELLNRTHISDYESESSSETVFIVDMVF